jgi:aminoglycoside phosphotransferase (APT) family kinase protein
MTETDDELTGRLARSAAGPGAVLERAAVTALPGGFVAKTVERLDLTLSAPGRPSFTASFVRKGCPAREVRTLEAVAAIAGVDAAPELIAASVSADAPEDPEASWFVSPFYPGETLHFGDPIPATVLTTLARVHAATAAAPAPSWAWSCDAAHIDRLRHGAERALAASARFKTQTLDHAAWAARLAKAAASPVLREAAEQLPRALTHGDMHPANIMRRADGSAVIIDWGNACLAPPMLDLANIIELGSPEWLTYVAAYEAAGGAFDAAIAERAYWWAKAATGLMYVPWAVGNSDRAPAPIVQLEDAAARLAAS